MKREMAARIMLGVGIVLVLAAPVLWSWLAQDPGDGGISVELHGRMPENGGWSPDVIRAQVGQPIHLRITSDDVTHSFAVGKMEGEPLDISPGEWVETTLVFDAPGTYTFYCDRWCGQDHWRMRGRIEISGEETASATTAPPRYVELGIDLDAPHMAQVLPGRTPSASRGASWADALPGYALDPQVYAQNSPAQLWERLRAEDTLSSLSDDDLWDAVAWVWQEQGSVEAILTGGALFAQNCAACHGESGAGDGVMVRDLPPMDHANMGHTQTRPPDFSDPAVLLGASPILLEGKILRGGMGTGMPYWGPIFTEEQIRSLVAFLYTIQFPLEVQDE